MGAIPWDNGLSTSSMTKEAISASIMDTTRSNMDSLPISRLPITLIAQYTRKYMRMVRKICDPTSGKFTTGASFETEFLTVSW